MTQVIEISVESRNGSSEKIVDGRCRIFSLRGCHLLAMFARTPVAKAFRRWVLDVIEQYGDQVPVTHPVTLNDSSMTPEQQARLHAVVDAKVSMVPKPYRRQAYKEIWTRFNRHFQIARYVQLPTEKVEDGIEYLLAMQVNAGKAQALEQGAFPAPSGRLKTGADSAPFRNTFPACLTITEAECERLIHEIEEAHISIMGQVERLCHRAGRIAHRLGQECQFRANMGNLRGKEGETLADSLYSYTTHMVVHAVLYPYGGRPLPTFQNPGYRLLGICRQLRGRA